MKKDVNLLVLKLILIVNLHMKRNKNHKSLKQNIMKLYTSTKSAIAALYREERTSIVLISWKEVVNDKIIDKTKRMKAWEALNLIENINAIAFNELYTA